MENTGMETYSGHQGRAVGLGLSGLQAIAQECWTVLPSQQFFAAWIPGRTMNYANSVQGTQNL